MYISFRLFTSSQFCHYCQSALEIEGRYQGKNLFIRNPILIYRTDASQYCIDSVKVNGILCERSFENYAFELKLDSFNLELAEDVKIVFYHKENCKPNVILTEHGTKTPIDFAKMNLDSTGMYTWTATSTLKEWVFDIEQFKWNKWVKLGEVTGAKSLKPVDYQYQAALHSGENKLRVKYVQKDGRPRYSFTSKTVSTVGKVEFARDNKLETVNFSDTTAFEIYDELGTKVTKGVGISVDVSTYDANKYYLHYDKFMSSFTIKRKKKK